MRGPFFSRRAVTLRRRMIVPEGEGIKCTVRVVSSLRHGRFAGSSCSPPSHLREIDATSELTAVREYPRLRLNRRYDIGLEELCGLMSG